MFKDITQKIERIEPLLKIVNRAEITAMARFLYERVQNPDSFLVFLGETSSGKSSLINGLLGKDILPMKANPTTATITEVILSDCKEDEYYVINKNATMERIDKSSFVQLTECPDEQLKRLRLRTSIGNESLKNLRIFDTPGYGSIVSEHEEVLKDFLPNSDIVVYTVNYKIGIQEEDYVFLGFLRELIRPDVEIVLVVNRCPVGTTPNNQKVQKIRNYVADVTTTDPQVFIVENIEAENELGHALPNNPDLWVYVNSLLNCPERQEKLYNAFNDYVKDLYSECFKVIESRYLAAKVSNDKYEELKQIQYDSANRIRTAIDSLINPTFDRINVALPKKFSDVRNNVEEQIVREINNQKITNREEMIAYTNVHLLPHTIKSNVKDIQYYIKVELDDLNSRVDDFLQKQIIKFNNDVTVAIQSHVDVAVSQIISNIIKEIGVKSLNRYFVGYGGAGGANAGIANAASHLLKKAGDLFNHTFSRATHNGLKQTLSKIGATSMKAIGVAIAIIVEIGFLAWELSTWKNSLRKSVRQGLDAWEKECVPEVIEDVNKLRDENIDAVKNIASEIENTFEKEKPIDIESCQKHYQLAKEIGNSI